jgi:transcriptional regulator with XRE-family HTH domain
LASIHNGSATRHARHKKRQHRETLIERLGPPTLGGQPHKRELAQKTGISTRMIAYYETRSGSPPIQLVQKLGPPVGVSADPLLGLEAAPTAVDAPNTLELRLWKKVRQLRHLPERRRRAILEVFDGLLDQQTTDDGDGIDR